MSDRKQLQADIRELQRLAHARAMRETEKDPEAFALALVENFRVTGAIHHLHPQERTVLDRIAKRIGLADADRPSCPIPGCNTTAGIITITLPPAFAAATTFRMPEDPTR